MVLRNIGRKGSGRRLAAAAWAALGLAAAIAAARPPERPGLTAPGPVVPRPAQRDSPLQERAPSRAAWWEVRVAVSVRGAYAVRGLDSPAEGTYACRARWLGRLELDKDDDFVLVHLGTEILEWTLREKARRDGGESVLERAAGPKPSLRMEYLLKDGTEVEFVFGLSGVAIPLPDAGPGLSLELPRTSSRQPGLPGRSYGDFVRRGACRVAIPERDFVEPAPERRFSWDWERERRVVHGGRAVTVAQSHTAEAVVSLVLH